MRHERIKTYHDLADLLEDAARVLRMLPPLELSDAQQSIVLDGLKGRKRRNRDHESVQERVALLAEQLPKLSRADAKTQLASLTVESIRQLAPMLDVRIPSKATKNEYIELLLTQLFDAPAGQELIRTFHKRVGRTAIPKPLAGEREVRPVPGGKDRNDGERSSHRPDGATTKS